MNKNDYCSGTSCFVLSKDNRYIQKTSVAPISHNLFKYSSNETQAITANLSASPTKS